MTDVFPFPTELKRVKDAIGVNKNSIGALKRSSEAQASSALL